MKTLTCSIYQGSTRQEFPGVSHVVVPSVQGQADIYPGYAESYFLLAAGEVRIFTTDGHMTSVAVMDAACSYRNGHCAVLVAP